MKIHPEGITKADTKMANKHDRADIEVPVFKKDYSRIKKKNDICINVFCFENNLAYPVHISGNKFEKCMDLMLITDDNKSHYVYIKDFIKFMCKKTKSKNNKHFCRYSLQYFSSERVLIEHTDICLIINGEQSIKSKSSLIKFKNYFKQLVVPFKIYVDFETLLKRIESNDKKLILYIMKNVKIIFVAVLLINLYALMINLANQLFFIEEKLQSMNLLKQFLKSMIIAKK